MVRLEAELAALLARVTVEPVSGIEPVQSLWGGYGQIVRVELASGRSLIVKQVRPPGPRRQSRGGETDWSHERKLRSYAVEMEFYRRVAQRCDASCRVPQSFDLSAADGRWSFVLEDLNQVGFPRRKHRLSSDELALGIGWLAAFHATFLGETFDDLWAEGSYWHLQTRPDEWRRMDDGPLKLSAGLLDERLRAARFRTLIHGDAKLANFCFPSDKKIQQLAAVDFQYVGGGVGVKDLAYFISSALDERQSERAAPGLLDDYFRKLSLELERRDKRLDFSALEQEWRELYPIAWADFYRFLQGWSPGDAELHGYSRRMIEQALALVLG